MAWYGVYVLGVYVLGIIALLCRCLYDVLVANERMRESWKSRGGSSSSR